MSALFTPPYPRPHKRKSSMLSRFVRGWNSWIHVMFEKSYTMKMGEFKTPGLHLYMVNELDLVDRILGDARAFPKARLLQDMLDPLIGNSVFSANGDDWEEQRAMVNPAFAHTQLKRVFPLMQAAVAALVERLDAENRGGPIAVDSLTTHVAADVIFRTLFSVPLDAAGADRILAAFNRFQRYAQSETTLRMYRLPTLGFGVKAKRAAAEIHAEFEAIVRTRHADYARGEGRDAGDILQSLLEARHSSTGMPFSADELMEQISTIFLAGHETAASAMAWALYLVAETPDIQAAVRAEIVEATSGGPIDYESLRRMARVRDVFRETLRLYPPVSFLPRYTAHATRMRDKELKAGATVVVSPWLVQRNQDHWGCPHAFDPGRFERAECEEATKRAYFPFGRGPRVCIGAGFAQQEAMLVLATLIRRYAVSSPAGDKPEPISRLTLRAKNGIRLSFRAVTN